MMSKLMGYLAPLGLMGGRGGRSDDDIIDRLNHSFTCMVIVIFAIIISTKQYVGDQIQCWVPGHFTSNYEDYANKVCWITNTYYVPMEDHIPRENHPKQFISYYQWVPMILLLQAIGFYFPCLIWRAFNNKSGIDINRIVDAGKQLHDSENKLKTLRYMVRMMDRYQGHYRDDKHGCLTTTRQRLLQNCPLRLRQAFSVLCGRKYGNYLLCLYFLVKVFYLANVLGQLFLLDIFLGYDFHFFGIHVFGSMIRGEDWSPSIRFPRVTLCDFKVRAIGNIQRHTVQCVLPINFFNEKIYIFIWIWYVVLSWVTLVNLLVWIARSAFFSDQLRYIRRHLRVSNRTQGICDRKYSRRFVLNYLRHDGVLLIRLVSANSGDLAASEFTAELWDHFKENPPTYYKKNENNGDEKIDEIDV